MVRCAGSPRASPTARSGRFPSTPPACAREINDFRWCLQMSNPMETLMKKSLLAAGLAVAVMSGEALAQAKPEQLVKQRQSAMTLMGKYFGPMAGMAQGRIPYDAKIVQRNAGFLDNLSRMPWDGFSEGTKDAKSAALP